MHRLARLPARPRGAPPGTQPLPVASRSSRAPAVRQTRACCPPSDGSWAGALHPGSATSQPLPGLPAPPLRAAPLQPGSIPLKPPPIPPTQPRPRLAYLGPRPRPPPGRRPVMTRGPSPPTSRSSPSPEDQAENPDKGLENANRHIALAHGGPEVKSETEVTLLPFLVLLQCLGFISGRPR